MSDRCRTAASRRSSFAPPAAAISLALPGRRRRPARAGALYTETNQPSNQVVVLGRDADGSIGVIQRIGTGGAGTLNNPPFGQNHLDVDNEVELTDDGRLLFAVNAGDNTVSSFRVGQHGRLTLADVESTAGDHPVSLDTHNGLLYVLNGLGRRRERPARPALLPRRRDGTDPWVDPPARHAVLGRQRVRVRLPARRPRAVQPRRRELTVTERTSNAFAGQLDAFAVRGDGTLGPVQANASSDAIPFGMAWDNHGHLIVPNAGPPPSFHGSGSSYSLSGTTLTPIDTEPAGGNATCWVAVTSNGKYAFMSNQMTEDVSRFAIGNGGTLVRLGNVPLSAPGADTALSTSSRFLYVLDVLNANGAGGALIDAYRVGADGSLVHLGTTDPAIPDSAGGLAAR
jgi:hypothetical protein